MLYGLLIAGGLLAYFAWKKNSKSSENSNSTTPLSHTSGVFVDDVPISQELSDALQGTSGDKTTFDTVKEAVSNVVEPLIGTKKQSQLSGQGQFLES